MRHINIPVFVPHKGCPNDCSFCNQRSITAAAADITGADVAKIVEQSLTTIDKANSYVEIAFFGGSFTGIEEKQQKELLEAAYFYKTQKKIDGIRLSTRPDYIDDKVMELLMKYGVTTVELGVQSTDDGVLHLNRRGHTKADIISAVHEIRKHDISLGLQMMLGLYGSNREKDIQTACDIIELKPDFVRVYPTLVIKGTYLYELYLDRKYMPLDLEEGTSLAAVIVKRFKEARIPVVRIGLMNSENIAIGGDVAAGPFHEAFGELVENRIYLDAVLRFLEKKEIKNDVSIYVNQSDVSKMIGHKRCNMEKLGEYNAAVKVDKALDPGTIRIGENVIAAYAAEE